MLHLIHYDTNDRTCWTHRTFTSKQQIGKVWLNVWRFLWIFLWIFLWRVLVLKCDDYWQRNSPVFAFDSGHVPRRLQGPIRVIFPVKWWHAVWNNLMSKHFINEHINWHAVWKHSDMQSWITLYNFTAETFNIWTQSDIESGTTLCILLDGLKHSVSTHTDWLGIWNNSQSAQFGWQTTLYTNT